MAKPAFKASFKTFILILYESQLIFKNKFPYRYTVRNTFQ